MNSIREDRKDYNLCCCTVKHGSFGGLMVRWVFENRFEEGISAALNIFSCFFVNYSVSFLDHSKWRRQNEGE